MTERLRKIRTKKGLTQTYLANLLEIKSQTYHKYEKGVTRPPYEILIALHEKFNVDLNWLLTGKHKEGYAQFGDDGLAQQSEEQKRIMELENEIQALKQELIVAKDKIINLLEG